MILSISFFDSLQSILNYTLSTVNFIVDCFNTIFDLFSSILGSLPSFISSGFILVFTAGFILSVISFVRG